jgi:hypothetical protein
MADTWAGQGALQRLRRVCDAASDMESYTAKEQAEIKQSGGSLEAVMVTEKVPVSFPYPFVLLTSLNLAFLHQLVPLNQSFGSKTMLFDLIRVKTVLCEPESMFQAHKAGF